MTSSQKSTDRHILFVSKLLPIDGFATGAVVASKVTALAHEVGDHTMECRSSKAESFFTGAEGTEVFGCFAGYISVLCSQCREIY